MKRKSFVIVNTLAIAAIIIFVFLYSGAERREEYRNQIENFVSTTVTMEKITENYLEGEQGICDVWAHYIVNKQMTMQEATDFIRESHVLTNTSAHVIDADTLEGLSTRSSPADQDDNHVSYAGYDLFDDSSWISELGEAINVTRAFTNPVNGEQSLAFCNKIVLDDNGTLRDGILLRIVPVSDLQEKWVFPQDEFKSMELSMIDDDGSYIIKSSSFKNSSFLEFYKSYNQTTGGEIDSLHQDLTGTTGSLLMKNSRGDSAVIAHTPILSTDGWVLLAYLPESSLNVDAEDWTLIGIVSAVLALLLLFDILYMQRINERMQEIAAEANAANKAKTDFLSTMSHDIRTPMNAIIGLTTIAEKNIDDRASILDNLRKISMAGNHLLTLINDILDISKVESGKLNLSPLTFSIVETVENLVNMSQPMIKEKNIDFNFRINRMETEYLYADQLRLNQIYINILSNALKYTQPGGRVSVDMKEEPGEKDNCVRLTYTVSDTGMGMSREFMEKMYQPFSRQTDSRVNSIQGTGLGLAITKQMVDLMDGTITCESEPGKGTTFTIVLDIPVADRQLDEMQLDPIDVLVVDDDGILLETAADTLKSLGANTETADDGLIALGMIRHREEENRNYDVVIIDWKMPGIDGVEMIRRIRQEIRADIPILLISAYDWSDIEEEAKNAGVSGFISKPLFRSSLYDKINDLLGVEKKAVEPEDDYSDIAGLNILIAEDNDINWEIIHAMLEMFGISSERAVNGRVCVDRMKEAEEGRYELIFMDVQMPEMNGLDATRNIRKLEDPWASSIPIIAMTADAFSEDVTACLDAGMNGHIAKPVDMKLVIKEIRRIRGAKEK